MARWNDEFGIFFEVSRNGIIASNVVAFNGQSGIAVHGSKNVHIWNNTAVDNTQRGNEIWGWAADISVIDDARCLTGQPLSGGASGICSASRGQTAVSYCAVDSDATTGITCNAQNTTIKNNILTRSFYHDRKPPLLRLEARQGSEFYGAANILQGGAAALDYQLYWRKDLDNESPIAQIETTVGVRGSLAFPGLAALQSIATYEDHAAESLSASNPYLDATWRRQGPACSGGAHIDDDVWAAIHAFTTPVPPTPAHPSRGAFTWYGKSGVDCP